MILCLETATTICSVAVCNREQVIMARESDKDKSHASSLTILIGEILNKADIRASDLEAIAVSKGPGSYTGLRIGVSTSRKPRLLRKERIAVMVRLLIVKISLTAVLAIRSR